HVRPTSSRRGRGCYREDDGCFLHGDHVWKGDQVTRRRSSLRAFVAASTLGASLALTAVSAGAATTTPRWVRHVQRYPGGISNGVRAYLDPAVVQARQRYRGASELARPSAMGQHNV